MKLSTAAIITAAALSTAPAAIHARINDGRTLQGQGNKKDKPGDGCVCIEIYEPVCGVDGQTYSNSCYADCYSTIACSGVCPCADDGTGTETTSFEVGSPCDHTADEPCGSTNLQCIASTQYDNNYVCLCNTETNEGCSETQVCYPLRGVGPQCYDCDCKGGQTCGTACDTADTPPRCYPKNQCVYELTPGLLI